MVISPVSKKTATTEVRYRIELKDRKGLTFDNDMDCLTDNPNQAFIDYKRMQHQYHGREISITKITETTTETKLSENQLENIAVQNA